MRQVTLCFLVKEDEKKVCLGVKKRGFGVNKFNGFGVKVDKFETLEEAAVRELREETLLNASPDKLRKVGELSYTFPEKEEWNQLVHVYLINDWQGEPVETEEMRPEWFSVDALPFDQMWQNDAKWLPLILKNKKIRGKITFNPDNESTKEMTLEEVPEFDV